MPCVEVNQQDTPYDAAYITIFEIQVIKKKKKKKDLNGPSSDLIMGLSCTSV